MIDRRNFANVLGLGLLGASVMAGAQPAQRLAVVGVLTTNRVRGRNFGFVVQGLRQLGYEEGKNLAFEIRSAAGQPAAFPGLAAELVQLKVDVIFAAGPAAIQAAMAATRTIPIIAHDQETDPVKAGWARSLARPSGNLTGLFLDAPLVAGKWVGLLREAAPGIRRIGLLWDATTGSAQLLAAKAAAQGSAIEQWVMEVRGAGGFDTALRAGASAGIQAIAMLGSPEMSWRVTAKLVADFAAEHRLPAISPFRVFSDVGGLMSYSLTREDFEPKIGVLIGKILNGAKPGDFAIELPTKFEFVINLKTAKALGLAIPQSLLLRADEVIQ